MIILKLNKIHGVSVQELARVGSAHKPPCFFFFVFFFKNKNKKTKQKKVSKWNIFLRCKKTKQKKDPQKKKNKKEKHHYMRFASHVAAVTLIIWTLGWLMLSVNIAEEQRSALKLNCTAKTHDEGSEREDREDRTRLCHAIVTAVENKNH